LAARFKTKIYDRDYYWFDLDKASATTDENGDFRISGVKPGPLHLTVQTTGYASELIDVRSSVLPLEIRLKPGQTVRGRVVDENGKPIKGVSVYARSWREVSNRLHLEGQTDAEGRFRLADAPADEVQYDLGKQGYMSIDSFPMSPSREEYTATIKAPLRIVGSVVDADSGQPLEKFSLTIGTDYDDGRAPYWMRHSNKTITDGRYETKITQEDFVWRLRVEAEGYLPVVSRVFRPYAPDKGKVTYDFKLSKADLLIGSVFGLGGDPLADADVYLATQRMNIANRKVSWTEQPPVKTDPAGRFKFPAEVEPFCIVVVHPQGIAMLTEKEFEGTTQISIQPWTPENHTLQIIRRPAKGSHVDFPTKLR
jgi:hypothetical protein